ncbi:hypothetical protein ROHU_016134 [Labeo rohita]|uniref:Uncharacterized protein n=1 Tax=Labeo rohita TaxID=84645 RepID=A0A498NKV1_LABRO|nr:hypothetical protein ROHU_016134 [Labeo rohita]
MYRPTRMFCSVSVSYVRVACWTWDRPLPSPASKAIKTRAALTASDTLHVRLEQAGQKKQNKDKWKEKIILSVCDEYRRVCHCVDISEHARLSGSYMHQYNDT